MIRFGREAKLRRLLRRADGARDARRWAEAAQGYAAALELDPDDAPIRIQLGHALKESGDRPGAEAAYRRAAQAPHAAAEAWFQLAHLVRMQGRLPEAIEAFRDALVADPDFAAAIRELVRMGARDAIPDTVVLPVTSDGFAAHPPRAYDAFRHAFPVRPPPPAAGSGLLGTLTVIVDGGRASAADVRATLFSLIDQTDRDWTALVVTRQDIAAHPIAGLSAQDPRIGFLVGTDLPAQAGGVVALRGGTALDPHAIAWIGYAAERTDCAAAYADHDHGVEEWQDLRRHADPVLQPCFDPEWFASGLSEPAMIYVSARAAGEIALELDFGAILRRIGDAGETIAHIPRLLATILAPPEAARRAPPGEPAPDRRPPVAAAPVVRDKRTTVVIPTRDQPALLGACVDALLGSAAAAASIDVVIVDNRSVESRTRALLDDWQRRGRTRVVAMDEPFNWSRANNLAAAASSAPHLLFLNNDTEMLTPGWDDRLSGWLCRPDVGVVGARLLYPDRSVQHAGVLLGLNDGSPVHEGVGADEGDCGPQGRWIRSRAVPAVTGAFMAMRREVWHAVGGFDEAAMPVGFSDIDLCLKVRTAGLTVVYAPELTLLHHESKTRGINVTRPQVAWDRAELRALYLRWDRGMLEDPGFNPHWSRHGRPFDGYREPGMREIIRHIDRSARSYPWAPGATATDDAAG